MSTFTFTIDGETVTAEQGQTILQAAEKHGIFIPRLCAHHDLSAHGSCRVCMVKINGRPQSSCTTPAAPGMVVESETEELKDIRRMIIEMLFVEGNHICPFCEKSGNCELQALAYRFGIDAPRFPYLFPKKHVDASHESVIIERNRCILCGRCVRASVELDCKNVFGFVDRGIHKRIAVDSAEGLGKTNLTCTDQAIDVCPVGALIRKDGGGYATPVGERKFDKAPIGSGIERNGTSAKEETAS